MVDAGANAPQASQSATGTTTDSAAGKAPGAHSRVSPIRSTAGRRYHGSVVEAFVLRMKGFDFFNMTTLFGAAFLFSTLPLIIILDSFVAHRAATGLAHHLGLNAQASQILGNLFVASSSSQSTSAIVTAFILSGAGSLALAASVQNVYEQIYGTKRRHRITNLVRLTLWVAALAIWLFLDAETSRLTVHRTGGALLEAVVVGLVSTVFFWWTMHLLLARRVDWRRLFLPAVVTALFWLGLDGFAAVYFSSTIISDSRLYGQVGVIFSLLTWFIAIAAVVVLGAVTGAVLDDRRRARRLNTPSDAQPT